MEAHICPWGSFGQEVEERERAGVLAGAEPRGAAYLGTGEHVIQISSLARREFTTVQIIGVGAEPPRLARITASDGPSAFVTTRQQFLISRTRRLVFSALIAVGFASVVYWGLRIFSRALPALVDGLKTV